MLLNRQISILYFINQIKWQLLLVVIFAFSVGYLHLHPIFSGFDVPLNILTLVGTIVSILLAFRTSQSYERWWEARVVWGAIVNDSRTFIRQISQFLSVNEPEAVREFAERQIIWTHCLGESLRRLPFSTKVQTYLNEHSINATNVPNALLEEHSKQITFLFENGKISEIKQLQLNETIGRLCDSMGKCERIKNTVFPKSYSLILQVVIYVFTALLPFALDHSKLFMEIALTILLPVMFISIEKTAILMQDPFENTPVDTPMTSIAQTIEINIRQMIGDKEIPKKEDKGLYYEM